VSVWLGLDSNGMVKDGCIRWVQFVRQRIRNTVIKRMDG
jgi:hypothetical protein